MFTQPIPFEIHITTKDLPKTKIDLFVNICVQNGGKPLLIELYQGECISQPMFSKVIYSDNLNTVMAQASNYTHLLHQYGFQTKRIKTEIPASCVDTVQIPTQPGFTPYFEWHGKIEVNRIDQLLELCSSYKAHLSRNSLKDEKQTRFLTLREYGSKEIFQERIDAVVSRLAQGGWQVLKQQSEYCLSDTNIDLDKGWLPN
ncbi:hypothetical protein Q0590_36005 [Rhodocytophaga aerolata]|uniref:Uncharacterized protein n=1 Tax=Rhodocytophaga aerolata TaxID=455078 RepID=A0ABT8RJS5_9BACT|nr:hypothetical protein [Rhodocytophaga aerolata]MDO1451734.1 hypothetical protein [Rhodocytophaga aerolata]